MKNQLVLVVALLLGTSLAFGASASLEFTPLKDPNPGTVGLQTVVVLCATRPGSAEFDAAWTAWVKAHPEADIQPAIQTVISRAGTMRSMSGPGMAPTQPTRQPTPGAISERMRWLANSARSNGSVRVISAGSEIR